MGLYTLLFMLGLFLIWRILGQGPGYESVHVAEAGE
jgi:hypothetical protein